MPSLEEQLQKLDAEELITLYQLDVTTIDPNGPIFFFTTSANGGESIQFGGQTYIPVDVEVEGYEWSSQGAIPRPKVRITNVNNLLLAAVIEFGDCLGATFRRIKTFRRFLDGEESADSAATFPVDVHRVERLANMDPTQVEWELSSPFDQEGIEIPRRVVLKDSCTHTYRIFDASQPDSFNYAKATCPYMGIAYFTKTGIATTDPSLDLCSKKLTGGCRLRFGNEPLPFRGFPGVGDVS